MKRKIFIILIALCSSICSYAQVSDAVTAVLSRLEQLQTENEDRINTAFAVMDVVQKAGNYIESLNDLFTKGELTLPVGIQKGDYELIIREIIRDRQTKKTSIFASCAFKFKENGQKLAFEGEAILDSNTGVGSLGGQLSLIAPVPRKMGKHSTIIVREGTSVSFGCDGIEGFNAKLTWMLTSDKIVPVDRQGTATNKELSVDFDAMFQNFDDYSVSLNIDRIHV